MQNEEAKERDRISMTTAHNLHSYDAEGQHQNMIEDEKFEEGLDEVISKNHNFS